MLTEKISWNAGAYDRFRAERMQPSVDLAARAYALRPDCKKILDVGCGSGMSTAAVAARFPGADILGLDLSEDMLGKARALLPGVRFERQDCSLPLDAYGRFDLIFSNAFLQWLDDQAAFVQNAVRIIAPGGLIALQVPLFSQMLANRCMEQAARSFPGLTEKARKTRCWNYDTDGYYALFSQHFAHVDLWETSYYHQMDSHQQILDFISGTALRQYLGFLDEGQAAQFKAQVLKNLRAAYPVQPNGKVLFPFRRLFLLAGN